MPCSCAQLNYIIIIHDQIIKLVPCSSTSRQSVRKRKEPSAVWTSSCSACSSQWCDTRHAGGSTPGDVGGVSVGGERGEHGSVNAMPGGDRGAEVHVAPVGAGDGGVGWRGGVRLSGATEGGARRGSGCSKGARGEKGGSATGQYVARGASAGAGAGVMDGAGRSAWRRPAASSSLAARGCSAGLLLG